MEIDESWLYPGTLIVLGILAYMQWQINAKKTMYLILAVMAYIVWSHETGHSLGELRQDAVQSFDEAVGNNKHAKKMKSEQLDPDAAEKAVKNE